MLCSLFFFSAKGLPSLWCRWEFSPHSVPLKAGAKPYHVRGVAQAVTIVLGMGVTQDT